MIKALITPLHLKLLRFYNTKIKIKILKYLILVGGPERFNPVDALDITVQCVNSNAYFQWKPTGKYPVSRVNFEYTCINVSSGHHHIVSTTFLHFSVITLLGNIIYCKRNFFKTSLKLEY